MPRNVFVEKIMHIQGLLLLHKPVYGYSYALTCALSLSFLGLHYLINTSISEIFDIFAHSYSLNLHDAHFFCSDAQSVNVGSLELGK